MELAKWAAAALGFAFATGTAISAPTLPGPVVFSNGVYHRSVCGRAGLRPGFAECHAHVRTDSRGNIMVGKPMTASPSYQPAGYGAFDLRNAYKNSGSGASTTKIAIVDAYGYPNAEADLAIYRTQMGLPACTSSTGCFHKINENGGSVTFPAFNAGWAQETALDLDMVSAMCPKCRILLVEATTNSYTDLGTAVNTAATKGAHAISNSYGGGEVGTSGYNSYYNHPGIAITASSGDAGYGVEFPASSPQVTAVGGTSLMRAWNGRGWTETAWSGAGSGCSIVYAKPAWQSDPLCLNRTVADVSAVADPATGVAVYGPISSSTSEWMVFGGTSAAAPIVAGIYGVNAGTVNYGQDPYNHTVNLFDVTSGSNGTCGGTYLCTSTSGYDGPTGLGTPNGKTAF